MAPKIYGDKYNFTNWQIPSINFKAARTPHLLTIPSAIASFGLGTHLTSKRLRGRMPPVKEFNFLGQDL